MRCWSRVYQHVTELTHFCVCAWVSVCMNVSILARANFALLLLLRLYEPWLTRERRRERDSKRGREGERGTSRSRRDRARGCHWQCHCLPNLSALSLQILTMNVPNWQQQQQQCSVCLACAGIFVCVLMYVCLCMYLFTKTFLAWLSSPSPSLFVYLHLSLNFWFPFRLSPFAVRASVKFHVCMHGGVTKHVCVCVFRCVC